jgi:putative glutamine amidotransferase
MHALGETYTRAVHRAGGTPVILPPLMTTEDLPVLLHRLDGLILSGGEDLDPSRYGQTPGPYLGRVDDVRDTGELALVRAWLPQAKPLLAICRGHQVLNVALGGTLIQDIAASLPNALDHAFVPARPMERTVHTVDLQPNSRLAQLLGDEPVAVNSAHHQAVAEVGHDLVVTAHAPDGVIEGLELPNHRFCLSVQWHPEAMVKVSGTMWPLFEAFVAAAAA